MRHDRVRIYSDSNFFERNRTFKVIQTDEKVIFEHVLLDWTGKTYSVCQPERYRAGHFAVDFLRKTENLVVGETYYEEEDESSEDKIVFYYE